MLSPLPANFKNLRDMAGAGAGAPSDSEQELEKFRRTRTFSVRHPVTRKPNILAGSDPLNALPACNLRRGVQPCRPTYYTGYTPKEGGRDGHLGEAYLGIWGNFLLPSTRLASSGLPTSCLPSCIFTFSGTFVCQ